MVSKALVLEGKGADLPSQVGNLVVALVDSQSGIPFLGKEHCDRLGMDFVHVVPHNARQAAADFQRAVLAHAQRSGRAGSGVVVVFCEDGYNLTGYCIVAFLRQVSHARPAPKTGRPARPASNTRLLVCADVFPFALSG